MVKLSIVMPVFNEKSTLLEIIKKVESVSISNVSIELVIVDDFSNDGTRDLLSKVKKHVVIFHEKNQGKGAAVMAGISKSSGDIIVIQDADLEYTPSDFNRLIKPIISGQYSVVFGSRFLGKKEKIFGKDKILLPSHYIGNNMLSFVTSFLYGSKLTDMETCYKMFKRDVLTGIIIKAKRFDFEPEITAKILKKGYKILEMPITFKHRHFSEGKKINWRDGIIAFWCLLKYRFIN